MFNILELLVVHSHNAVFGARCAVNFWIVATEDMTVVKEHTKGSSFKNLWLNQLPTSGFCLSQYINQLISDSGVRPRGPWTSHIAKSCTITPHPFLPVFFCVIVNSPGLHTGDYKALLIKFLVLMNANKNETGVHTSFCCFYVLFAKSIRSQVLEEPRHLSVF